MIRQYGRDDVEYETWYSTWAKQLAKNYTAKELETMLYGTQKNLSRSACQHHAAIKRTGSMAGNSAGRASTRQSLSGNSERVKALNAAIEIHELFPEHAKR